jgi:excisionase family DNA binding protein
MIEFKDRNFSIKEAAAHLRVSESYVWKLLKLKKLRAFRLGARTLITGAELQRIAAA